jgi:hypothetical protein
LRPLWPMQSKKKKPSAPAAAPVGGFEPADGWGIWEMTAAIPTALISELIPQSIPGLHQAQISIPMPADAINIIQSSGVPFGPQPTAATIAQNAAAGLQPGGPNLFSSIAQALASVGGAAVTAGLRPGYPSNLPQPGTLGYSLSQPVPGLGISYGWVIGGAAGLVFLLMLTKRR